MSWLFSRALVEAFSQDICSDGEQSAQSSGTHTQVVYSSQDKTTEFSRRSLSGMTCKLLTENRGKELLTSFRAAFHAKTYQRQEKEQESMENDQACGHTWRELSVRFDRDSSSWRTHRCLWDEVLPESSVTLPRWGMMRRGVCWERLTSGRRIKEIGSGSSRKWLTPTAHNAKETNAPSESKLNTPTLAAQVGGKLNPLWTEWLLGWPLGWTDLKPLGMDKFQRWLELHGVDSCRQSKGKSERQSESDDTDEDHVIP